MAETAQAEPLGVMIAEITTARGPIKVYSPSLDDTEEILTILSGPATALWKRLEDLGRASAANGKATASLIALAAIARQTTSDELVRRLEAAAAEAKAVPPPAREQIEAALQATIKQSGAAIKKALGVLLKLHADEVGRAVPSARLGDILEALRREFKWQDIQAHVKELVRRAQPAPPEAAQPEPPANV